MRSHQTNPTIKARYEGLTDHDGHWTGKVVCREDLLDLPVRTRKPTLWSVWTDLFHEAVCARTMGGDVAMSDFQLSAFRTMTRARRHRFLVLTKRAEQMEPAMRWAHWAEVDNPMAPDYWGGPGQEVVYWPVPNIALGVTAEDQPQAEARVPKLLETTAAMRFVSLEPLLGAMRMDGPNSFPLTLRALPNFRAVRDRSYPFGFRTDPAGVRPALDWVIVGCESGPGRRHTRIEWVRDVARQCQEAGVPVFVKQIEVPGSLAPAATVDRRRHQCFRASSTSAGRMPLIANCGSRVSHNPAEWPADLRVRELPEAWLEGEKA